MRHAAQLVFVLLGIVVVYTEGYRAGHRAMAEFCVETIRRPRVAYSTETLRARIESVALTTGSLRGR